jgi:hypothetical protein
MFYSIYCIELNEKNIEFGTFFYSGPIYPWRVFGALFILLNTLKNAPHTPWLSEPNLTILIFEFNHKKSLISLLFPPPKKSIKSP